VSASHRGFGVLNRTGNPALKAVLRSPAHRLLSGNLALISVTGRRSGRVYTFPVGYRREGEAVTIGVGWPERKRWWRNLREPGRVTLRLAGQTRTGVARAIGDETTGVRVEVSLDS
jgi:deazaflavin-dependent oxidoreductase (nitroreductase family)